MFVVEFQFGSPVLQEALSDAPEMTVTYEEIYHADGDIAAMFWAEGVISRPSRTHSPMTRQSGSRRRSRRRTVGG